MKPVKSLHTDFFSDNTNHVCIGNLSQEQIDFIEKKCPDYIGLLKPTTDIIFWKDRIKHIELHRDDFMSDIAYNNCFESIPDIIKCPDYISIHPKDHSLIFIKELSAHISVAYFPQWQHGFPNHVPYYRRPITKLYYQKSCMEISKYSLTLSRFIV